MLALRTECWLRSRKKHVETGFHVAQAVLELIMKPRMTIDPHPLAFTSQGLELQVIVSMLSTFQIENISSYREFSKQMFKSALR